MQRDPLVLCEDILAALTTLHQAIQGDPGLLERDPVCRAAVERSFEIIGEAIHRWERADPRGVARITDFRLIIGLRNLIAHGYDSVDPLALMDIIRQHLPRLEQGAGDPGDASPRRPITPRHPRCLIPFPATS